MSSDKEEVWKDIPGYEGYYQASTFGRIRRFSRIIKSGWPNSVRRIDSRIIGKCMADGYYRAQLQVNGKLKRFLVHRLVAMTFIPNPENKKCING